ncbi:hypothetical protein ACT3N8_13675 [Psychrobacter aquimaris]|uniref:hypothetical protein n=1 Tax=Psychrobacter aquimaris TaxID=292733 RepID=UPI003FD61D90
MKKLLLSLAFSLGALSVTPAMAAAPAFSASQMAQVKIKDLSFKEVMREFYSERMGYEFIDDEYIESMPNIGLDSIDSDGERTVALMHPVLPYKNVVGEPRYLTIIEKVQVNNGSLVSCHVCGATADLYSFQKLNNGQFQLVSKTPNDVEFSTSWGRVGLYAEDIQNGLQPLGKNLMGSIFMNGYTSTGTTDSWWDVLFLPENDFINIYTLGDAGSNNAGNYEEDSPLYYSYDVAFKVIPENTTYYPIKLTYKGDKPTDDYERINSVNYSKIVKFNPVKKAYE